MLEETLQLQLRHSNSRTLKSLDLVSKTYVIYLMIDYCMSSTFKDSNEIYKVNTKPCKCLKRKIKFRAVLWTILHCSAFKHVISVSNDDGYITWMTPILLIGVQVGVCWELEFDLNVKTNLLLQLWLRGKPTESAILASTKRAVSSSVIVKANRKKQSLNFG